MHARRVFQGIVFAVVLLPILGAQSVERPEEEGRPQIFDVDRYGAAWITGDTNGDGNVDYALQLDDQGEKRFEVIDYNFDGRMDDFYYYRGGVLDSEELDTNYDGAIDLWIEMHGGVYVAGYERDTNYDGEVEVVKRFGDE